MSDPKYTKQDLVDNLKKQFVLEGIVLDKSIEDKVLNSVADMVIDSAQAPAMCCIDKIFDRESPKIYQLIQESSAHTT